MKRVWSAALPAIALALLAREGTNISWAHLTFNPWIGCTKVSPACDHCYAEGLATTRLGVVWGPGAERRRTAPGNWAKPLRWQKVAAAAGVRFRVFCASLADWADKDAPAGARADLAQLIRATPNLDWMLLTKRIPNAEAYLRAMFPEGVPPNVWLGITVADQAEANRDIPRALATKAALGITRLFLSMEPLLGPVDLTEWLWGRTAPCANCPMDEDCDCGMTPRNMLQGEATIDLVICGGESGKDARPMHPVWPLEIGDQCWKANKVAFHFKQWGEWAWTQTGPFAMNEDPPGTHRKVTCVTMDGRKYEGNRLHQFPDGVTMIRIGPSNAGRSLAGREWLEDMAA